MKRRTKWTIITLIAVLGVVLGSSFLVYTQYTKIQDEHERVQQTLTTQTNLIAELRRPPKNFDTINELTNWVNEWETNNKPIAVAFLNQTFVIAGNNELYSQYWDCDDISEAMQRDALRDKYLIDRVLLDVNGVVYGTKVSELGNHAGNMAVAGNAYYYIEPQTGEIVMITERD